MYVCMYVWMDVWMHVWMYAQTHTTLSHQHIPESSTLPRPSRSTLFLLRLRLHCLGMQQWIEHLLPPGTGAGKCLWEDEGSAFGSSKSGRRWMNIILTWPQKYPCGLGEGFRMTGDVSGSNLISFLGTNTLEPQDVARRCTLSLKVILMNSLRAGSIPAIPFLTLMFRRSPEIFLSKIAKEWQSESNYLQSCGGFASKKGDADIDPLILKNCVPIVAGWKRCTPSLGHAWILLV